jgi:hypothetical protein
MTQGHEPARIDRGPTLTLVELTFVAGKIEQTTLFGRPLREETAGETRRILYFRPHSIFCLARWSQTAFGSTVSRLDVLRTTAPGEPFVLLPFVRPGVQALLRLDGSAKVERVRHLIDEIWSLGIDPADAAPDYWFHVGNRLAADQEPRTYSKARHAVWKLRQRLMP